jgi:hypothetical protein
MFRLLRNIILFCLILFSCSEGTIEHTDEDWSFVVYGDLRIGYGIYSDLVDIMVEIQPTPIYAFCLGDILNIKGNEAEWANFWRCSEPLTNLVPIHIARGNHEGNDKISEQIFKEQTGIISDTFYYALKYDQTLFLILDSFI